jgi:putative ATPase
LSLAEKSNASYTAYQKAVADVRNLPEYPVPLHIRNAPTGLMKELGYGRDYLYPHDYDDAMVAQAYLPEPLQGRTYYLPESRGYEAKLREFLAKARRVRGDRGA